MFLLFIFIVFIVLLYFYANKNHNYWLNRNVKHDPPVPFLGNHYRILFGIESSSQVAIKLYYKYPSEKVIGYYRGYTPELIIKDPDIIRQVLNSEFQYFYRRGLGRNPDIEPILLNLFSSEGDAWKLLRHRLTPAFTTAKLKSMFPLIINCAKKLETLVKEDISQKGDVCDVRELMARFTTEFIGACGFGIEMDTINNEKSLYRELGRKIFAISFGEIFRLGLYEMVPAVRSFLYVGNKEIEKISMDIVRKICDQRNNKPSGRNDFIDQLLELEAKGKMEGESMEKIDGNGKPVLVTKNFDFKVLYAQAFVFFAAGFETSSSSSSYTLHELAFNPEVQSKVQEEIDAVLAKFDNILCYEAIAEMKLLSMAFKEGMRMFPSLGVLNRECVKKYTIPGTNITIDKGVRITIPVHAIHMDEKYYDNPKQFRPERFSPDEVSKRHKYVYLPFGEGPRACIGSRLGEMQSLAGLAAFLHKFSVEPAANSLRHPEVEPQSNVVQAIKGGIPLRVRQRSPK